MLTLQQAHGELAACITKKDVSAACTMLEECQQAAIAIGEMIEESEGEGTDAVRALEAYCELAFTIHEELASGKKVDAKQTEKQLNKSTRDVRNRIYELPTKLEAVFLSYKASMWDSLESVWRAADADPDCDAYVVPIPYFDKNNDGTFTRSHYEIDQYPEDVPVIRYDAYNLEERHPDMIFFHNPYDQYNYVTSVHPDFYSQKLKACTDCLVYIPYYATTGRMAEGQTLCMGYIHADHIIVQSQGMVEQFEPEVPRNKFRIFGSPKFDRVIRLCKNPPEVPADWKKKMEGKRVFFYNTSINGMLSDTKRFLKKMRYVFDTFQKAEGACLLWRPHPLLKSTLESLRGQYVEEYEVLIRYYKETDIGIFDTTPDIETAIAHSDAFIGDAGTSVTALFGVAGKPVFLLNNRLTVPPGDDDWKAWVRQPLRNDRNNRYCITMGNRLFEDKDGTYHYRYLCDLSDDYTGGGYYARALEAAGKIVVLPANAEHILIIDPETLEKKMISLQHEVETDSAFAGFFNLLLEEPDVYYLFPNRYSALVQFDARTEQVKYFRDEAFTEDYSIYIDESSRRIPAARWAFGLQRFLYGEGDPKLIDYPEEEITIPGMQMKGRRIFCLNKEGTRLRAISLDTGQSEERALDWNGFYTGVMRDIEHMDVIWFLPYEGTVLGKWTLSEDRFEQVDVRIEGLYSVQRPKGDICEQFVFSNGVFVNGKLYLAPNWGTKFVELDCKTHEVREWVPPFSSTTEDKNDYWYNGGIGNFFQDPWTLESFFYYAPEHIHYAIDFAKGICSEIPVTFDENEIRRLAAGFHRDSQWMPYCCYEDVFNPLENLIADRIEGPVFEREKQIEAFRMVNVSPDGDCGEKVYRYMKEYVITK
ncbi:MAG: hypothetical protein IJP92_10110 [Lachnospiraceae bacterium]|nr:hypothetical protein [Lachnospiraceae bacterium]